MNDTVRYVKGLFLSFDAWCDLYEIKPKYRTPEYAGFVYRAHRQTFIMGIVLLTVLAMVIMITIPILIEAINKL